MRKYSTGTQSISLAIRRDLLDRLNDLAEKSGRARNGLIIDAIEIFLNSRAARLLGREAKMDMEGEYNEKN